MKTELKAETEERAEIGIPPEDNWRRVKDKESRRKMKMYDP